MWIHNFVTVTLVLHGPITVISTTNTHTHTHTQNTKHIPIKVFPVPGGPNSSIPLGGPRRPLNISLTKNLKHPYKVSSDSSLTQILHSCVSSEFKAPMKRNENWPSSKSHHNCSLSSTKLTRLALTSVLRPFGVHWSTFLYICAWFNAAHFIVHLSKLWVQLGGWTDWLKPQTPNTI